MILNTLEAVVENGQVRLPRGVILPERKNVYLIITDNDAPPERAYAGFRLANPADAAKFELKVEWGGES